MVIWSFIILYEYTNGIFHHLVAFTQNEWVDWKREKGHQKAIAKQIRKFLCAFGYP